MSSEEVRCPLCESSRSKEKIIFSAILNLPGNSDSSVFRCRDCRVYYLWPHIPDDLVADLYSKSYFTGVSEIDDRVQVPPSSNNYENEFATARAGKFRETVKELLKYVPNTGSILDIGAATGDFLAVAREHGLSTSGIEVSSYASAKANEKYGFLFHETGVVQFHSDEIFDIVHMNHVFEHFGSPHLVLDRVHSLLKPRGLVYVEVPFQFSIFEILKYLITGKRKRFDVFSIHHPIFYRPTTLRKIFDDHGFTCRSMRVFSWSRYPVGNFMGGLKLLMWFAASLVGHGLMIEAIFERKH